MNESDDDDEEGEEDELGDEDAKHKTVSGKLVTLDMIKEWRKGLEVQYFQNTHKKINVHFCNLVCSRVSCPGYVTKYIHHRKE